MTCPSEETWAAHVDGELPPAEGLRLLQHAAGCARCRALETALRDEAGLLARVLEEAVPSAAGSASPWLRVVLVAAAFLAAAVGAHALSDWLATLEGGTLAGLVNGRSVIVGLLADTLFYLLREGASMLDSILEVLGVVGLVGLAAFVLLTGRRGAAAASLLAALFVASSPALALEARAGKGKHGRVVVAAGETVDDSLFAAGETVTIDGVVTGNLIAAARTILVRGTVRGDLVTAAHWVEVSGSVEGNVFAGGETVIVRGPVGRSVHGFAQKLRLESPGSIRDDLVGFGAEVTADGRVGRDVFAFCGETSIQGEVGRNATAHTRRLLVDAPARIGGDVVAYVHDAGDLQIGGGAQVSGRKETRLEEKEKSRFVRPGFYLWRLIWLAAAFATGLVLHRLFPSLFAARLPDAGALVRALGLGFVALVAVPIGAVVAAATLVGLPLGLLVLMAWAASLYVAPLLVAALAGRRLLGAGKGPGPSIGAALLVGLVLLTIVVNLPYVGGLARLFVILLGLGLGVVQARRRPAAIPG